MAKKITMYGFDELESVLKVLSSTEFERVRSNQLRAMQKRAVKKSPNALEGGTPFDTGELRKATHIDFKRFAFGYTKDYAIHVEYGHRTRNGGYVKGQYFLQHNVEIQRPRYKNALARNIIKIWKTGKDDE